jgi:ATP-binding cassette, subfamily C, bacterial CydC
MKLPLSLIGLALAVLAETCSMGLLGLSGWFIASSAVAGASAYSTFSYLAPSGGVRAFALGRIAASYASRVVLHSAALRRISAARLRFYDRAAAEPATAGTWSGASLDRVMADADTRGMALIQAAAPMVVAAAITGLTCLVIAIAGYCLTAVIVAGCAAVYAGLAIMTVRHTDDENPSRGALRAELVSAVDAWTEMASLGAADRLTQRTLRRFATFEDRRFQQAATLAWTTGTARAVTAAALLLVVVSAVASGADVATLVFITLLVAGMMQSVERLVPAAQAWVVARQADKRLDSVSQHEVRPAGGPTVRTAYVGQRLCVSGYWLPATPTRPARELQLGVGDGQMLVVTGASGSGKTTLLNAIATTLRQTSAVVVTAVLADDYLFSGTVASNIRLANPTATDQDIKGLLSSMLLDRGGLDPSTRIGVDGRSLSGGEQRRLHIARALATGPDVLLIDEPATGLDAATANVALTEVRRRLPSAVLVVAMHELPPDPEVLGSGWSSEALDGSGRMLTA